MQLSEVVATHRRVAEASGRGEKAELLAELLGRASEAELPVLVGLLSGRPRQGRIGVGPSLLRSLGDPGADTAGALDVSEQPDAALSVLELDAGLSEIATTAGPGARGRKAARLRSLLRRGSAEERAFVSLLVIGELRQGAGEGVLLDAVARATGASPAEVRRDVLRLGGAAAAAERHLGADSREAETGVLLFRPLAPMLASTAEDAATALAAIPRPLVEAKADGARVQVHRRGGEVRVYTRRSNEITEGVPELVSAAQRLPGGDLVLDGEAVAWGASGPLPFQVTMRRIGAQEPGASLLEVLPLRVFFFDCLYADGDLLDRPLGERREALTAVVPAEYLLPFRILGDDVDRPPDPLESGRRIESFLDEVRAAGFEGLMIKDRASPYRAGRRGGAWLKLKPVSTLDLVVLAAEWGSGRRRGWLSNLHLGAKGEEPGAWVMLGKTFKGMTDEVLAWQTDALLALETHRDGHTVHVRPELVVEIAFEGVQRSPRYPGGVSLRFARLRRYREDKVPGEADAIGTVRALLAEGEPAAGGSSGGPRRGRAAGRGPGGPGGPGPRGSDPTGAQRDLFDDPD
jgi:DNA ligase-1